MYSSQHSHSGSGGCHSSSGSGGVVLVSQKPLDPSYTSQHQTIEPSEVGVIPPQYRTQFSRESNSPPKSNMTTHVHQWNKEEVCSWLLGLGMEMYIPMFMEKGVTGDLLLALDTTTLKQLGVVSKPDRDKIKEKVKELRKVTEKEKKKMEKERKPSKSSIKSTFLR